MLGTGPVVTLNFISDTDAEPISTIVETNFIVGLDDEMHVTSIVVQNKLNFKLKKLSFFRGFVDGVDPVVEIMAPSELIIEPVGVTYNIINSTGCFNSTFLINGIHTTNCQMSGYSLYSFRVTSNALPRDSQQTVQLGFKFPSNALLYNQSNFQTFCTQKTT
jgi:hypothetical protein